MFSVSLHSNGLAKKTKPYLIRFLDAPVVGYVLALRELAVHVLPAQFGYLKARILIDEAPGPCHKRLVGGRIPPASVVAVLVV